MCTTICVHPLVFYSGLRKLRSRYGAKEKKNKYSFGFLLTYLYLCHPEKRLIRLNKMTEEINKGFRHVIPLQIRFNDVDKFGHVNNTIYFQFYDTAKTDYFASVCKGVDWERVAIVVVKIEAEFLAQIKADSHIAGRTRVVKIGHKSFHLEQDVIDTETQEVKSRCFSIMVLYDLERHETMPFPDEWRRDICNYDGLEYEAETIKR